MDNEKYYHVRFNYGDNVSYQTPSADGRKIIPIYGSNVTKMEFADGNELFNIIHDDVIDVFATFPIVLEYN